MKRFLCRYPGCSTLAGEGEHYCETHRALGPAIERKRLEALPDMATLYNTSRWRTLRARVIKEQGGTCANCGAYVRLQVHHLRRPHGDERLFFLRENLIGLCRRCHEQTYTH